MENFGYALWLEPDEPERTQLQNLIRVLSDQTGAPRFRPHCTVLAHIEGDLVSIRDRVLQLVSDVRPFSLKLLRAETRKEWSKCLYLSTDMPKELRNLNAHAQQLFEKQEEFLPHISVLYGAFPERKKDRLIRDTGFHLPCQVEMNTISLNDLHSPWVDEWEEIEKFSL